MCVTMKLKRLLLLQVNVLEVDYWIIAFTVQLRSESME